jgi:hypothetical protein
MTMMMNTPVGDANFIAEYMINTRVYGVVVPPGGGTQEFWATYEIQSDQGTLMMAVVIGPKGAAGANAFAMHLQTDPFDSPDELPNTLTNTVADIGKYWAFDDLDAQGNVIGSSLWVWYGGGYRRLMLGSPGPPGPVPIITPSVSMIGPDQNPDVLTGGTPLYPTWELLLPKVPGPQGPAGALALCPDVNILGANSGAGPSIGDLLGFTGQFTTGQTLSPPTNLIAVAASSGGSIAAGPWHYMVTGTNAAGETTTSNEYGVSTSGTTSSVDLTWDIMPLITHYKIYRGTAPGTENTLVTTVAAGTPVGGRQSYTDTGAAGTSATPPSSNTAVMNYPIWVPVSVSSLIPSPYSMPESAFTSFSGLAQRAAIGSFPIPAQPYDYIPIVWGHLGAFGLELSADPLTIGAEVRLNNQSAGPTIGRGFGNTLGEVNIVPHFSDPNNPAVAITPTNNHATVAANTPATLYVNLYNDGAIGIYQFSPTDAQLFVQVTPV